MYVLTSLNTRKEEMEERIVEVTDNFTFDVSQYLSRRYSDPYDKERGVQPFYLQSFHNFYKKFHSEWDSSSAKLLEFGGGPVIYPLISASPHFSDITFADYLQMSLDTVKAWRDGEPSAHNWKPYIQYVVHDLEGENEGNSQIETDSQTETSHEFSENVIKRQTDMQSKMKTFCKCNIRNEYILVLPGGGHSEFTVVSSSLCLEAVPATLEEFKEGIRKVSCLLKPSGFLISLISLQQTYWVSRGAHHPHLYLEKEDVKEAFVSAGLNVVQVECFPIPEMARNILNDCGALCFIAGQRSL